MGFHIDSCLPCLACASPPLVQLGQDFLLVHQRIDNVELTVEDRHHELTELVEGAHFLVRKTLFPFSFFFFPWHDGWRCCLGFSQRGHPRLACKFSIRTPVFEQPFESTPPSQTFSKSPRQGGDSLSLFHSLCCVFCVHVCSCKKYVRMCVCLFWKGPGACFLSSFLLHGT